MQIQKLRFSNYRSIGEESVTIDLTKKVNVVIGANNSGKSNVIRALLLLASDRQQTALLETDRHKRNVKLETQCELTISTADDSRPAVKNQGCFRATIGCHRGTNVINTDIRGASDVRHLMSAIFSERWTGNPTETDIQKKGLEIAYRLVQDAFIEFPNVVFVPQFRQIVASDSYGIDGKGVIKLLATWQHPKIGHEHLLERFLKVQKLLRELTDSPTVELEVPHDHDKIIVKNDGLRLPLDAYGTGIHQIIILAIAVLSQENAIVCIEEPEIHLHPLLQRRFIEFLHTTDNRYVLTTHSSALIDLRDHTAVCHVWLEEGVTKSRTLETSSQALKVLHDLGIRASDLLQANSVIWVEGPSDRIYLNCWLKLIHPTFREDIDYSIMFYGGRLLSHLSLEREVTSDPEELIKLLRINQHSAIIIDSDRRMPRSKLNGTKLRIKSECEANGVFCWITHGREIENYLPSTAIAKAYHEITNEPCDLKMGPFDSLEECLKRDFGKKWRPSWSYDAAKPDRARRIGAHLDLSSITSELRKSLDSVADVVGHVVSPAR